MIGHEPDRGGHQNSLQDTDGAGLEHNGEHDGRPHADQADLDEKFGLTAGFQCGRHLKNIADDQAECQRKEHIGDAPLLDERLLGDDHGDKG